MSPSIYIAAKQTGLFKSKVLDFHVYGRGSVPASGWSHKKTLSPIVTRISAQYQALLIACTPSVYAPLVVKPGFPPLPTITPPATPTRPNPAPPDHHDSVAAPVRRHRLILNFNAEADNVTPDDLIEQLIEVTQVGDSSDPQIEQVIR